MKTRYLTSKLKSLNDIKSVLITRTDRLGDLILTMPMAQVLKTNYPGLKVFFLVSEYAKPIAELSPFIDELIVYNSNNWQKEILTLQPELCLMPHINSKLAREMHKLNVTYRMGNLLRIYWYDFNLWIIQKRKTSGKHELDLNLEYLFPWCKIPKPEDIKFNLVVKKEDEVFINNLLNLNNISKFSIIHPGSGGSAVDLDPTHLRKFISDYGTGTWIFTGSEKENGLIAETISSTGERTLDLSGKLTLGQLAALYKKAKILLANSTGPLHLARALEVPVLGFYSTFPPLHPKRWGPYNQMESNTLIPPTEKYSSFAKDKAISQKNLQKITPAEIGFKINEILKSVKE